MFALFYLLKESLNFHLHSILIKSRPSVLSNSVYAVLHNDNNKNGDDDDNDENKSNDETFLIRILLPSNENPQLLASWKLLFAKYFRLPGFQCQLHIDGAEGQSVNLLETYSKLCSLFLSISLSHPCSSYFFCRCCRRRHRVRRYHRRPCDISVVANHIRWLIDAILAIWCVYACANCARIRKTYNQWY